MKQIRQSMFLASVIVISAAALLLMNLSRTKEDIPEVVTAQTNGLTQFAITYTSRFMPSEANEYDPPIVQSILYYSDSNHSALIREGIGISAPYSEEVILNGECNLIRRYQGKIYSEQLSTNYELPPDVIYQSHLTMLENILGPNNPITNVHAIAALTNTGVISDLGTTTMFDRLVQIIEVDKEVHNVKDGSEKHYKIWYDSEYGIKYKVESTGWDGSHAVEEAEQVDLQWSVDLNKFGCAPQPEHLVELREVVEFNQSSNYVFPAETDDVLVPSSSNFSSKFTAGPQVFITNTIINPLGVANSHWSVMQQMESEEYGRVVIIQAFRNKMFPDIQPLWPAHWDTEDPTEDFEGLFESSESFNLHENVSVIKYDLVCPDDLYSQYKYLVLWDLTDTVTVGFLANCSSDEDSVMYLVNEFIDTVASQLATPTPP